MNQNNTSSIVSKVWAFCNTLRDDGVGYGDYLEQLTYLLFLKMADEEMKAKIKADTFTQLDEKFKGQPVAPEASALIIYGEK